MPSSHSAQPLMTSRKHDAIRGPGETQPSQLNLTTARWTEGRCSYHWSVAKRALTSFVNTQLVKLRCTPLDIVTASGGPAEKVPARSAKAALSGPEFQV